MPRYLELGVTLAMRIEEMGVEIQELFLGMFVRQFDGRWYHSLS